MSGPRLQAVVAVNAQMRTFRSFEDADVHAVFRAIFEKLDIPPETANHLPLRYRESL